MNSRPRIEFLGDHPEILPVLREWFMREWEGFYGPGGSGDVQADLSAYTSRSELPIGVVAFFGDELCGCAALKAESFTTHLHLGPWAGALLVSAQYRRKGVGSELVRRLEELAGKLGYDFLYCGTSTASHLLQRRGWNFVEQTTSHGREVSIYSKAL